MIDGNKPVSIDKTISTNIKKGCNGNYRYSLIVLRKSEELHSLNRWANYQKGVKLSWALFIKGLYADLFKP